MKARARPSPFLVAALALAWLPACTPVPYHLELVKVGVVGPLSEPSDALRYRWVESARAIAVEWNTTVLAGRPVRIELVIYDEADGPAVPRRLAADPQVMGVVAASGASAPAGIPAIVVPTGSVEAPLKRMLHAVTEALDRSPGERRDAVRSALERSTSSGFLPGERGTSASNQPAHTRAG